jgi:hypothetical protein
VKSGPEQHSSAGCFIEADTEKNFCIELDMMAQEIIQSMVGLEVGERRLKEC